MTVASPDPRNILGHVPGRICVSPTDLTTAYPHGGTDLGEVGLCRWSGHHPVKIIEYEEWGVEPVEAVSGGEAVGLAFTLREFNLQGMIEVCLNAAAGGTSGHPLIQGPSTNRAGYLYSARSKVWCFSPKDTANHPFVVFYKAWALPMETTDIGLSDADQARWGVPVAVIAARDASSRVYKVGRGVDIVL